ncbi:hypothetical protein [Streptomyces sp. CC219B]|uniref:hypothetical protein n=1 Tax=Streptomyces sp. CC219B TaxID=3044574 RepID=UPI0024A946C8|nr:hypothetical protein [Streptomyces sp. CC219B]
MLALRLTRSARPAVQLRRLLVAAASAGTGFLLLCTLGHALTHPDSPGSSFLRLLWCAAPLAATVYFALAVARTDPGTRPRPGLAAIGLGPVRLMAVAATTTALSTLLGSMLALLVFLHLRGDLTGMPFDGAATDFLAASEPLPLPAALTLLSLVPAAASLTVALTMRPREPAKPAGMHAAQPAKQPAEPAGMRAAWGGTGGRRRHPAAPGRAPTPTPTPTPADAPTGLTEPPTTPAGLPWGTAVLAAGLTVGAYARKPTHLSHLTLTPALLLAWTLTAVGLAVATPGLTHLCGRLLQSARPGPLRLLAGRALMEEATRIGRPLGVVCAVAAAAYATAVLHTPGTDTRPFGPLTALGATVVTGCAIATLLTAAVEARQARADTTAALLRLGAPATMLRSAAALRTGALLAMFGPLTVLVAELAALPLAR